MGWSAVLRQVRSNGLVDDLLEAPRRRAGSATRPFVTFLMVSRRLRPGYDYLVARKLSSFWRDLTGSALQPRLTRAS